MIEGSDGFKAVESHLAQKVKAPLIYMLEHIKPFEGLSHKTGDNVKFYDEREWRHVPFFYNDDSGKLNFVGPLTKEEFNDPEKLRQNNSMLEQHKLSFEPKDIKYVIVRNENEILEMVDYLHRVKSKKYDENQIKILTSRIITCEQIQKDF